MNVKVYLKIKVIDRNGKCIYYRRYRSRSFVANFLRVIYTNLSGVSINNVNTNGNSYSITPRDSIVVNAVANAEFFGIQIGSGTKPPSITDNSLSQVITSGTGVGQMQYGATSVTSPVINTSNNTGYIQITRTFTNNSGSSITVSEVGIVAYAEGYDGQSNQPYLIIHDLLPSPITVPNGSSLTIAYDIQVAT
jgi:hypothetical protein